MGVITTLQTCQPAFRAEAAADLLDTLLNSPSAGLAPASSVQFSEFRLESY
jgi:hypothetical protein